VKLLLNPRGHLELTPAVIWNQTGLRPKDLSETTGLAAVKEALERWRKVPLKGQRGRGWKLEYSGDSVKV
jgi:hypothetical protein